MFSQQLVCINKIVEVGFIDIKNTWKSKIIKKNSAKCNFNTQKKLKVFKKNEIQVKFKSLFFRSLKLQCSKARKKEN